MSSSELAAVSYELSASNATDFWSNLPTDFVQRHGLALADLSAVSKAAAEQLLSAALTSQGQQTMADLRLADDYLGAYRSGYDADLYYLSFLGTPSASSPWVLEFTGHHYTFLASVNGGAVSLTPNFVGVEPVSFSSGGTSYQPMEGRRQALLAMLQGLDASQLAGAKLSQAYDDLLVGPQHDGEFPSTPSGLAVAGLDASQRARVAAAIESYACDARDTGQDSAYSTDAALDETYIAWASYSDLATRGSYVRIDGPRVWIELSVQNGIVFSANHYHSIWRDKTLDYGGNFAF